MHLIATQDTQRELQNEEHKREPVTKDKVVIGCAWNYSISKAVTHQEVKINIYQKMLNTTPGLPVTV